MRNSILVGGRENLTSGQNFSKTYRTTHNEFSQLIFWGEMRQLPKLKKKSVRQILSYLLNRQKKHIFLFCKKSVLQILNLFCMNVLSDSISNF